MKVIIISAITFGLISCGSDAPTVQQVQSEVPVAAQTQEQSQVDSIDAVTSATAVANNTILNGVLTVPAQNYVSVTLPIDGTVKSVDLISAQVVQKGDVLATLENPQFIELQYSYLDALAQCDFLAAEYERQRNLSQEEATSGKRLQQSKAEYLSMKSRKEASAAQLELLGVSPKRISENGIMATLEIKAPVGGYVANLNVNQGKHITAGQAICDIVNKSRTLLKLTAYEKDLSRLKVGNKIKFRVNGISGTDFDATILTIGQNIDATNRSLEVYAQSLSNHPDFRPGMYVTAKL